MLDVYKRQTQRGAFLAFSETSSTSYPGSWIPAFSHASRSLIPAIVNFIVCSSFIILLTFNTYVYISTVSLVYILANHSSTGNYTNVYFLFLWTFTTVSYTHLIRQVNIRWHWFLWTTAPRMEQGFVSPCWPWRKNGKRQVMWMTGSLLMWVMRKQSHFRGPVSYTHLIVQPLIAWNLAGMVW